MLQPANKSDHICHPVKHPMTMRMRMMMMMNDHADHVGTRTACVLFVYCSLPASCPFKAFIVKLVHSLEYSVSSHSETSQLGSGKGADAAAIVKLYATVCSLAVLNMYYEPQVACSLSCGNPLPSHTQHVLRTTDCLWPWLWQSGICCVCRCTCTKG